MIKKVNHLKTIRDKFKIEVDVFELTPPLYTEDGREAKYLTGAFYVHKPFSVVALYPANKSGEIIDEKPMIHEQGLYTYREVFQELGYTLI